jgi:TRAP-type uncharacterized transport system fused permease subunit
VIALTSLTAAIGVAALAGGLGGWVRAAASWPERAGLIVGGLLLFYAAPWADTAGVSISAVVLLLHFRRTAGARPTADRTTIPGRTGT